MASKSHVSKMQKFLAQLSYVSQDACTEFLPLPIMHASSAAESSNHTPLRPNCELRLVLPEDEAVADVSIWFANMLRERGFLPFTDSRSLERMLEDAGGD